MAEPPDAHPVGPRRTAVVQPVTPELARKTEDQDTDYRLDSLSITLSGTAVIVALIVLLILVID